MKKIITVPLDKSSRKAFLFITFVILLVLISFVYRLLILIKESSYNGKTRFNVEFLLTKEIAVLISFEPSEKTVDQIFLKGRRDNNSVGKIIGAISDGKIDLQGNSKLRDYTTSSLLLNSLINYGNTKSNLTPVDIFRLYMFSKTLPVGNNMSQELNVKDEIIIQDKIIQRVLADKYLVSEQKSIEIVNGTNVEGLGKRLERLIRNSGGNVIAVSSSQEIIKQSKIYYYKNSSYTLMKIEKLLHYPIASKSEREIADIKIIIGKDGINNPLF